MNDVKIIFFDIDGTLIDMERKRVTERTLDALRRLRARGIRICLATGRSPITLPRFEGVTFDALLTFNGSYCYDQARTIFSQPIPPQDVRRILSNAAAMGRPVCAATRDRLAANGRDADLVDYFAIAGLEVPVAQDFEAVCRQDVFQFMAGSRAEEYAALMDGVSGAKIAAWWDRAVDVIPAAGGKGTGIEKTLAYFGLGRAQAMAFGDGGNDLEMFGAVGMGVAMENASAALKAAAGDLCGPAARDGVCHYLEAHGLI
ncbi:MAG: Cof-type HAD-IIB family hydrolase [Candidatus Ventricola sp.]